GLREDAERRLCGSVAAPRAGSAEARRDREAVRGVRQVQPCVYALPARQLRRRARPARPGAGDRGAQGRHRSSPFPGRRELLSETRGVLPLVELAEPGGALDGLPPLAVVAVPVDRRPDPVLPAASRRPAERTELRGVQRVAAVVARTVLDVTDERAVGAEMLEHEVRQLDVLVLFVGGDVVHLAGLALTQDELDPGAVIVGMQPVAYLATVAVERERLGLERVRGEER